MIYFALFWPLMLTILIEGAAMALLFHKWRFVYYSFLCNLLTNPSMNLALIFVAGRFGAGAYAPALVVLECVVVLVEAYVIGLLCGFRVRKAMGVSFLLNALSYSAGVLIQIRFL